MDNTRSGERVTFPQIGYGWQASQVKSGFVMLQIEKTDGGNSETNQLDLGIFVALLARTSFSDSIKSEICDGRGYHGGSLRALTNFVPFQTQYRSA
jgi:hypothetical protein